MKSIYKTLLFTCLFIHLLLHAPLLLAGTDEVVFLASQPEAVRTFLEEETDIRDLKNIKALLMRIDDTYGNLLGRLKKGDKIVIHVDPAHGMLKNGRWRGPLGGRYSCTGKPEEYYSLLMVRDLYKLLSVNRHISISSTDDHMACMKGESDSYYDITFADSIKLAFKNRALFIISEHLNNVSLDKKAGGLINTRGIHVTRDRRGRKYLSLIKGELRGFLTLYNKLDTTGFSRYYAYDLKRRLMSIGMKPNFWQRGTVADDRFVCFIDFPISIIYETGFISNPRDEALVTDPEMRKKIVEAQYQSLLESVREIFSVDISGPEPLPVKNNRRYSMSLFKLSRMAIYYLEDGDVKKGAAIINKMKDLYGQTRYRSFIDHYIRIKNRALKAERFYQTAQKYRSRKKMTLARAYYLKAIRLTRTKDYFDGQCLKYKQEYQELFGSPRKDKPSREVAAAEKPSRARNISKRDILYRPIPAPMSRTFILPIEWGQDLEEAVKKAMNPDEKDMERIMTALKNASITYKRKETRWVKRKGSRKLKKVVSWKQEKRKISFTSGIYLVRFTSDLTIQRAERVTRVQLNDRKYQNEQYLNNSFFARHEREKKI